MNTIRSAFYLKGEPILDAPSRVAMQQLSDHSVVLHNYNQEATAINLQLPREGSFVDAFTGKAIPSTGKDIHLEMSPRSRIWVRLEGKK